MLDEKFWGKVVKQEGEACWFWTGGRTRDGYGQYTINGRIVYAHRYAYEQVNGPLLPGEKVCHSCDQPSCQRPDHLFKGTQAVNLADMWAKGRGRNQNMGKPRCKHGHEFTPENTRLTSEGDRVCLTCARDALTRARRAAGILPRTEWKAGRVPAPCCKRGHRLEGTNLRIMTRANGKVERICRECVRLRNKETKARALLRRHNDS